MNANFTHMMNAIAEVIATLLMSFGLNADATAVSVVLEGLTCTLCMVGAVMSPDAQSAYAIAKRNRAGRNADRDRSSCPCCGEPIQKGTPSMTVFNDRFGGDAQVRYIHAHCYTPDLTVAKGRRGQEPLMLHGPLAGTPTPTPTPSQPSVPEPAPEPVPVPEPTVPEPAREYYRSEAGPETAESSTLWALVEPSAIPALRAELEAGVQDIRNEFSLTPRPTFISSANFDDPAGLPIGLAHEMIPFLTNRLVRRDVDGFRNHMMLVGPAGTGKTYMGSQLHEVLCALPSVDGGFAEGVLDSAVVISCSEETLPSDFTGPMVPNLLAGPNDPPERHRWTSVLDAYVNGGILILDEFDALMSGALLAMNAMLANRRVLLQNGEYANRHADFVCIAIGNTFGTGADDVYSGRNTLDGASLNRFAGRVFVVNYDPNVERGLMSGVLDAAGVSVVYDRINSLRERMVEAKVRQIISTRHMQQASIDYANGDSLDLIEAVILSSWSPDERRSVGYNSDPAQVIADVIRSEANSRSPVGSPTGAV